MHPELFKDTLFMGASTGAIVACCACIRMDAPTIKKLMGNFNSAFSKKLLLSSTRLIRMLSEQLRSYLPDDAHIMCSNRLYIAYTEVDISLCRTCTKQRYICEFQSNDELINAIVTSCSIPLIQDTYPIRTLRGSFAIDSSFTSRYIVTNDTIVIDWNRKAALETRRVLTPTGDSVYLAQTSVAVYPAVQLPPRIITPPIHR